MRIFSTKAFRFDTPGETSVSVQARAFATVPDWVQSTRLFQLALQDEAITIVTGAQMAADVEQAMADGMAPTGAKRSRVTSAPATEAVN